MWFYEQFIWYIRSTVSVVCFTFLHSPKPGLTAPAQGDDCWFVGKRKKYLQFFFARWSEWHSPSPFWDRAALCQTPALSKGFHPDSNAKNGPVLNEESLVVPGSADGYLGNWQLLKNVFAMTSTSLTDFLMALSELSLTWTLLQMKWKVVKCAALTLLEVSEETWNNSEFCF